ncbi:MAG: hypothetical protein F6J90_34595 [Moorea sp. SIOASIH]|nr:hypothetical protein [Moorena sp. SIOASIH]
MFRWVGASGASQCLDAVAHGGNPQDRAASLLQLGKNSGENSRAPAPHSPHLRSFLQI